MAALMSSMMDDLSQLSKYARCCAEMGIKLLPPDVNVSERKFTVEDGKIRFGLRGIKGVGDGAIDEIVRSREENGKPGTIFEFVDKLGHGHVNKSVLESLIKAGATESLSGNRAQHMAVYEKLLSGVQDRARRACEGQISLFGMNMDAMQTADTGERLPDVADFNRSVSINMEKEVLGLYLSGHPLSGYENLIKRIGAVSAEHLAFFEERDGLEVLFVGIVTYIKTFVSKSGALMAFVDFEDMTGEISTVLFPKIWEKYSANVFEDAALVVRGRLSYREDEQPKILADKVTPLSVAEEYYRKKGDVK
jgi:DNA polymerase-3 subunit alpha